MKLKEMENKKILILGFAREGQDTLFFLKKAFPKKKMAVADRMKRKDLSLKAKKLLFSKTKGYFGKNYLKDIKKYDLVVKSPGISPFKIKSLLSKKQTMTSQTEIFFDNCPGTIVGVTGTKGKSTTSALIFHILKKAGYPAKLVGNTGKPALSSLLRAKKKDIFVYELSSHQLFSLKKSPHIAVFLNIFPEHLDYYGTFARYFRAKANIARHQKKGDYLVFNRKDRKIAKLARSSKAEKIPIEGEYYSLDFKAAEKVAKIFGIAQEKAKEAFKSFRFLPHRMEFVGKFKGVSFYNDSLATVPEAAIGALDCLGGKVQTLVAGGFDRGLSFRKLAERIIKSRVDNLILFPETGIKIWREIRKKKKERNFHFFFTENMRQALSIAFSNTDRERVCLLSPASPSFGLFKDYRERGRLFKKFAKYLGKLK